MKTIALGDALDLVIDHRGKTPKKLGGDWAATGHRVVSAINVKDSRINDNDHHYISDQLYAKWMPERLRAGDVLLTSEAPLGEVAYLETEVDWAIGQRLFALRAKPEILHGRYLYYLLMGGQPREEMFARSTGTTVSGIRQSELVRVGLALPPVPDQEVVADTLGALDYKIASNRRAQTIGEQLIRALVAKAFEDSIGEPATLGDYCRLVRDPVRSSELSPDVNYIGFEHMPRGSIFLNEWGTAEGLGSSKSRFQRCDVLFGKLRPYFKKVGVAPIAGVCSTDILVLRANRPGDVGLVAAVAASDELIDSLSAAATGTRMPRASWSDLAKWPLPLLAESEREALAALVEPILERLTALTVESHRLRAIRDTLLPEMLSGRLAVTGSEGLA